MRRLVLLVALAGTVIVLVAGVCTAWLFVWPATDDPLRADAVVVFGARGSPRRLPKGLELVSRDVARVLVVTAPPRDGGICRSRAQQVVCVEPRPFTTRGESRMVAALAEKRGWKSLALVTSTYHVTRARLLLDRCFEGHVDVVDAKPTDRLPVRSIVHEWGGLAYALSVGRGC